jgi:hydroxyethylthiazole kinase-like uncharacterized protein yjeF
LTPAQNGPGLWLAQFPWPEASTHKHRRGRLAVVSGPASRTGAARLAARAGLRIGAGVVTVLSPPSAVLVHAVALEAVMVRGFGGSEDLGRLAGQLDAAVIGPAAGVGEETIRNVEAVIAVVPGLVLDADALTSFQAEPERLFAGVRASDVLTPHEGEFERLWPGLLAEGREVAALRAAEAAGSVLILKGPETLVAAPDGRLVRNGNGVPWLATAGSGDVLTGLIGGLMAQGSPAFDAACAAVWIHAEAAAAFGPGLIAEDLPGLVPAVLGQLRSLDS